jgi:hypothetical protein
MPCKQLNRIINMTITGTLLIKKHGKNRRKVTRGNENIHWGNQVHKGPFSACKLYGKYNLEDKTPAGGTLLFDVYSMSFNPGPFQSVGTCQLLSPIVYGPHLRQSIYDIPWISVYDVLMCSVDYDFRCSSIWSVVFLRPILLFANTDVSTTKTYLDTSILAKSIMDRRE